MKEKKESTDKTVTWGPVAAVLVTIAIYLAGQFFGALLASLYPALRHWNPSRTVGWLTNTTVGQFWLILLVEIVSFMLLVAYLRLRKSGLKALGWRKPQARDIAYALAGFGVYFVLYVVAQAVLTKLVPGLNVNQKQQIGFEHAKGIGQLALVMVSLVVLPPLLEETLVRGFLYTGLRSRLKFLPAMLVTSVMFAAAHLQFGSGAPLLWVAAIDTFVLSLVLVYLRERTGGLWASIGLHMLKNGLAFVALFIFHAG